MKAPINILTSTNPVEVEHKVIKDYCCSQTSGATLAPVCHRAVCKHLNAAHVQKGNADMSLPLRKRSRMLADTGVSLGLTRHELPHALGDVEEPLPVADAHDPLDGGAGAGDQLDSLHDIGGGNPPKSASLMRACEWSEEGAHGLKSIGCVEN